MYQVAPYAPRALEDLIHATTIESDKSYHWRERGIIHFMIGEFQLGFHDYKLYLFTAFQCFTTAIHLQPDSSVNYHFRGVLFYAGNW